MGNEIEIACQLKRHEFNVAHGWQLLFRAGAEVDGKHERCYGKVLIERSLLRFTYSKI